MTRTQPDAIDWILAVLVPLMLLAAWLLPH